MFWKGFVCLSLVAAGGARAGTTVDDLVRTAAAKNREVLALRQRVAEAEGLLRQAGVRPAPALEVETATGRPLGSPGKEEYAVGYFYPLETGGKRAWRVEVARKSAELAAAEIGERLRTLAFEVKSRHLDTWADERKIRTLDRLLALSRASLKLTEARIAEGDAAALDRQLLLVEITRAEAQRAGLAGRAHGAALELRALMELDSADPLPLPEPRFLAPRDSAPAGLDRRALELRPDLRMARLLEQQGAAEVDLASAQGRPDVTLSARYAHRNERFDAFGLNASGTPVALRDRDNIVTLGISVPLLTRGRNQGNIAAAAARAAGARLRREHLERTIPLEVEAARRRLEGAARALVLLESAAAQAAQNLEVIRQAHALGQLRMLDVLNEQRRLADTELAFTDAQVDAARALAELERALGGPLP